MVGGHLYSGACLARKARDLLPDLLDLSLFDFLLALLGRLANEVTDGVRVNCRRNAWRLGLEVLLLLLVYLAEIALDHVHVELGIIVFLPRLEKRHHAEEPGISIDRREQVVRVVVGLVVEPGRLDASHQRRPKVRLPRRHERVTPYVARGEVARPLSWDHALQEVIRCVLHLILGHKGRKSLGI